VGGEEGKDTLHGAPTPRVRTLLRVRPLPARTGWRFENAGDAGRGRAGGGSAEGKAE